MEKKKYERSKEWVRAQRIFYAIQVCCALVAFGLLFVDWRGVAVAVGVLGWNCYFYQSGCQDQVIDEYEQDGYPQLGLERMFQSWIWLAVCLSLVFFYVFRN